MTAPYTNTRETQQKTICKNKLIVIHVLGTRPGLLSQDPHNDARYLELREFNLSTAAQPSRKRVHVPPPHVAASGNPNR
ncbi:hypothetical protein M378DRAFT_172659 [Amanita muscaria Koide BX008]|uniref:Uncharacterized protein n=1 Tax=Amanita muscaria (strain Koide BX008) TaxID=946122 RepID=A0A0C2WIN3_AMAMK|nr:hypothetical protein M378DRAFT_172659 [Amanita muscaria Koide BX008]